MTYEVQDVAGLEPVCREIIRLCHENRVVAIYGQLGAGKTTFVQECCRQLGVADHVTSPTYAIVNEYDLNGEPVYHIDLYRLHSEAEALQTGLTEYLYSGHWCLVEWPDHFENLLPDKHLKVFIRKLENENRAIEVICS